MCCIKNGQRPLKNCANIRILSRVLVPKFIRPHHAASDSTLAFGWLFAYISSRPGPSTGIWADSEWRNRHVWKCPVGQDGRKYKLYTLHGISSRICPLEDSHQSKVLFSPEPWRLGLFVQSAWSRSNMSRVIQLKAVKFRLIKNS